MRNPIEVGPTAWFLFTDVEDSTRRWDADPSRMVAALAQHDALIEGAVLDHDGDIVKHTGDGIVAVFNQPHHAVHASVEAQSRLFTSPWPGEEPLRVRIGVHGGSATSSNDGWYRRADDFVGPAMNRCARVMAAARGGQVLCTQPVVSGYGAADSAVEFVDLGPIELRGLAAPERVFQVSHSSLPANFLPPRSRGTGVGWLPVTDDELVGRSSAADAVADALRRRRVVTLTGVGGVGKTRLALRVAEVVDDDFPDGVWFVPLAAVTDPRLLPDAIAHALEIRERVAESLAHTLLSTLSNRRACIVLDNCEHILDDVARLVTQIVAETRSVRILATSRARLDVAGEHEWPVPRLEVPALGQTAEEVIASASVRLIAERARATNPAFVVDADNVATVAELCRRLDGVPLAIELAASRFGALSPAEILERLDERFNVLGRPRASGRHATLREAIAWSYDLLDAREQAAFRQLAVFVGPFGAVDAAGVAVAESTTASHSESLLEGLARKSVLDRLPDGRFRLLESLRDFAWDKLDATGEAELVLDRHCDHFCTMVENLAEDIRGPHQARAYESITTALDNVRVAFDRLIDAHDAERALRLVRVLRTFWAELHPTEGFLRALDAVRIADDATVAARAAGFADLSWIAYVSGREDASNYARTSIELSERSGIPPDPEAMYALSLAALFAGDTDAALEGFERGLAVAREIEDEYEIAAALTGTTLVRAIRGDVERAIADSEEGLERSRRLGYDTQIAAALAVSGFAFGTTDPARAARLLDESLSIKEDTSYSAAARVVAGHLRLLLGDIDAAVRHFDASLHFYERTGDAYFVPTAIEGLAGASVASGDASRAARLLGVATMAREKLELPGLEIEILLRSGIEAMVGSDHEETRLAGMRASLDEGLREARSLASDLTEPRSAPPL